VSEDLSAQRQADLLRLGGSVLVRKHDDLTKKGLDGRPALKANAGLSGR
jgi:hypothetical protein